MASRSTDLISKKTNCTCSTLFFLISKKTNLHVQHSLLSCFVVVLHDYNAVLYDYIKHQTITFMEELWYVLTQYFVSCVHVLFYFSLALIYTLLAAPFWPLAFLIFSPSL